MGPLMKWAGGKESELDEIVPLLPEKIDRYYEPFLGGGALFFASQPNKAYLNDASEELMLFYRCVSEGNKDFFRALDALIEIWDDLQTFVEKNEYTIARDIFDKEWFLSFCLRGLQEIEEHIHTVFHQNREVFSQQFEENYTRKCQTVVEKDEQYSTYYTDKARTDLLETILKSAFYMTVRFFYNWKSVYELHPGMRSALFFFIREQCYAGMFRYNARGEFNVPYGGFSYNRKDFKKKVQRLYSERVSSCLTKATLENKDFLEFLVDYSFEDEDFIFLDPPYHSEFSTYSQNEFDLDDHKRLADFMKQCRANFLLVIKDTPQIRDIYKYWSFNSTSFTKKYRFNIQSRNSRETTHLLIRNYHS